MRDEIFWGNLLGLLRQGRWDLSLKEAEALIAVYLEAEKRSRPPKFEQKTEPIKKPKVKDAITRG